jgi:hypothetical protein
MASQPGAYGAQSMYGTARPRQPRPIDIHEMLKAEAFDGGDRSHFEQQRPAPPRSIDGNIIGVSDQYIVLDSFLKLSTSNTAAGEFQWNFMVQGVTGAEVVGVHDRIDTVIEMQFGGILMPPLPPRPYGGRPPAAAAINGLKLLQNNNVITPPAGGQPAMSFGASPATGETNIARASSWTFDPQSQLALGQFTIQVAEAGLQSISDFAGARHHLDYCVWIDSRRPHAYGYTTALGPSPTGTDVAPMALYAAPLNFTGANSDTYTFTEPLKDVHGIALRFRGPDSPLAFDPDCYYNVVMRTDAAFNVYFTVDAPNGLNVGDRVLIRNFSSGNAALNAALGGVGGAVVTGAAPMAAPPYNPAALGSPIAPTAPAAGGLSTFTYYFDPCPNVQQLGMPASSAIATGVTVCVLKLRMRVPVRLRRVVQRLTNYKNP